MELGSWATASAFRSEPNPNWKVNPMKTPFLLKLTSLAFLALFSQAESPLAYASSPGSPIEDPILRDLRSRFENGINPSREDLVEKEFQCLRRTADGRHHTGVFPEKGFYATSIYVIRLQTGTIFDNRKYVNNGREWLNTVKSNSSHSLSSIFFESIRKDAGGNLLIEAGVTEDWNEPGDPYPATLDALSAAPEHSKVIEYSICAPKN
jgi:hypothetical protein